MTLGLLVQTPGWMFFPLPKTTDLVDRLVKASFIISIDLSSAYYYVRVADEGIPKTIFSTYNGLHKYILMLFGLCNAPATFYR